MKHWRRIVRTATVVGLTTASLAPAACRGAAESSGAPPRAGVLPNIVWIVADGLRPPFDGHVAGLAAAGVSFSRTVPMTSVPASAQGALLTGVHPAALGLDEQGLTGVPAAGVTVLPEQLRRAGYYTSRVGPVRHNLAIADDRTGDADDLGRPGLLGAWDAAGPDADWRGRMIDWDGPCTVSFGCGRPSDTRRPPFFTLFNLTTTGPASPDREVGAILAALETDGLVDTSVVFLVGGPTPGAPLIVRWPGEIEAGTTRDEPVRVIDLAPTALALAGIPVPAHMQGRVLLGPATAPPRTHDTPHAVSAGTVRATAGSAEPPTAAAPAGYPAGGLFHVAPRVELSCETEGATIVYTTELVEPFHWRLYRGPFRMRFWTLRAQCGRLGYGDSAVVSYDFDIE
jgi:hypothetical protein